jgi:membrane associated rhomboid family serine protease
MSSKRDPVGDLGLDIGTAMLAMSISTMWVLCTLWGSPTDPGHMARMGAWTRLAGWSEPWRLLSHTWLHFDLEHLVMNLLSLVLFGWPLERAIGWRRLWLLYACAAACGCVLSAVVQRPVLMAGASGAIFGLRGALASLAVRPRRMLHSGEVAVLREAVWPMGLALVLMSFQPGTSWSCHLGGLAVGVLAGATGLLIAGLEPRAPRDGAEPEVAWGRAATATLGVGVLAFCCRPVLLVLAVAYTAIVGLVARSEPRYSARDGWPVTSAALIAGALLWGSGALALTLGSPWRTPAPPPPDPPALLEPGSLPFGGSQVPVHRALRTEPAP